MADEPQVKAENEVVAEESNVEASPAVEEQTSDVSQETESQPVEEAKAEPTEVAEETKETPAPKPTRAERRIRNLTKQLDEERKKNQLPSQYQQPQYPQVDPGSELTPEQYQQHVVQAADTIAQARVQEQMQQYTAQSNLEKDTETIPTLYPELDEDSDQFNPVLYDRVEAEFKRQAFQNGKLNPNARLAEVAKDFVEVARSAAERASASTQRNIEKAKDEAAVTPSSTQPKEKSFSDMSIEEMEAKLGTVYQ